MSDELNWLSAREMARRFAKGEVSPVYYKLYSW